MIVVVGGGGGGGTIYCGSSSNSNSNTIIARLVWSIDTMLVLFLYPILQAIPYGLNVLFDYTNFFFNLLLCSI